MTVEPWWQQVQGSQLAQGDYLPDCVVPMMPAGYTPPAEAQNDDRVFRFDGDFFDLIILTQSCDLENAKVAFVAAAPIFTIADYETANPKLKSQWEAVRRGRWEGLHMLAALRDPLLKHEALVVDFRQIHSLPFEYLSAHAERLGSRMRLRSPYLEHFSQSFARFFMRVGLPCAIPSFK